MRRRSSRSRRLPTTWRPSSDSSRPRTVSRFSGSIGRGRASRPWRSSAPGTTTSLPVASVFARRRRRREKRCGWNSRTVLADAIEATLPPREDRDPDAPLFPGAGADRLRTAIARACKAAAIPTFSPHDLRHRRISLLHRQGRTWAEIGQFVGQRKLSVTSDTYTHVLNDGREVDLSALLADA
jgi:integrase